MKRILPFLILTLLSCPRNPTVESPRYPDPNFTVASSQGARPVDFSFTARSANNGEQMSLEMMTEIQTDMIDPLGPTPVLIPGTDMGVGTLEVVETPGNSVKIFLRIDLTAISSFETSMGRAKTIRYPDGSYLPESCRGQNRTGGREACPFRPDSCSYLSCFRQRHKNKWPWICSRYSRRRDDGAY